MLESKGWRLKRLEDGGTAGYKLSTIIRYYMYHMLLCHEPIIRVAYRSASYRRATLVILVFATCKNKNLVVADLPSSMIFSMPIKTCRLF
jgi:hypothetical protein